MNYLIYKFYNEPSIDLLKNIFNEYNFHPNKLHPIIFNLSLLHVRQPYETMKYLLDKGGDPNLDNPLDNKPIHFQKDYKTIRLLLDRGAIPNPRDVYDFTPLYWQKDLESVKCLLKYNLITNNFIYNPKNWSCRHYYNVMLIEGGYDPYSENNISITPAFLQRDPEVLDFILEYMYYNDIPNYDIAHETILFKPCINRKIINVCWENNVDINHQNVLGNTALHVQHDINIIGKLLYKGADYTIRNLDGLTPYEYHKKKNNYLIYYFIERFSAITFIQYVWKKFWFRKTYIPPKYYKMKKKFLEDFTLLPPSECGTFPGGIEYQNAYKDFKKSIENLSNICKS
jgi:ankyrin repeat protein